MAATYVDPFAAPPTFVAPPPMSAPHPLSAPEPAPHPFVAPSFDAPPPMSAPHPPSALEPAPHALSVVHGQPLHDPERIAYQIDLLHKMSKDLTFETDCHERAAKLYRWWYLILVVPTVTLSASVPVVEGLFAEYWWRSWYILIFGAINTILVTIANFMSYQSLAEKHAEAAQAFNKLKFKGPNLIGYRAQNDCFEVVKLGGLIEKFLKDLKEQIDAITTRCPRVPRAIRKQIEDDENGNEQCCWFCPCCVSCCNIWSWCCCCNFWSNCCINSCRCLTCGLSRKVAAPVPDEENPTPRKSVAPEMCIARGNPATIDLQVDGSAQSMKSEDFRAIAENAMVHNPGWERDAIENVMVHNPGWEREAILRFLKAHDWHAGRVNGALRRLGHKSVGGLPQP